MESSYAIGQAVYIRTDTPDYARRAFRSKNLDEMVKVCTAQHENLTLEKIIVLPCQVANRWH